MHDQGITIQCLQPLKIATTENKRHLDVWRRQSLGFNCANKNKKIEEMYVLEAHGVAESVHRIKGATERGRGDVLEHMVNFEVSVYY